MILDVGKVYTNSYGDNILIILSERVVNETRYRGGDGQYYDSSGKLWSIRDVKNHYSHLIQEVDYD